MANINLKSLNFWCKIYFFSKVITSKEKILFLSFDYQNINIIVKIYKRTIMAFENVLRAIEDIKNGKMVVMVDDEDRENEGDLVFSAASSDMQKVNFAITHAKGVLCLAMDEANAKRLDLPLMVAKNTSSHETAFTVTIDTKDATTGVSAYEHEVFRL